MKHIFIPWVTILFVFNIVNAQNSDSARKWFIYQLNIIRNFVEGKTTDSLLRRAVAIELIEELTKIESESDYYGGLDKKINPTRNDYLKWKEWYERNKLKLIWDKKNKTIACKGSCI